jgi:hypothetical protein
VTSDPDLEPKSDAYPSGLQHASRCGRANNRRLNRFREERSSGDEDVIRLVQDQQSIA